MQKTAVKKFETIDEITGTDEQGKKVQGEDSTLTIALTDDLPRVLASYPVIYFDKASNSKALKHPKKVDRFL